MTPETVHAGGARSTAAVVGLGLVMVLLAGCASVGPAGAPAPPSAAAEPADPLTAALAVEQRWLQDWFRGTPVRIVQRDDGSLAVDVPREFCFDTGRSRIKPALAAVLDKVAESLRRRPSVHLNLLAAPGDAAGGSALALQRASQVRQHLRRRGVPGQRLAPPVATGGAAVQLQLGAAPARSGAAPPRSP